MSIPSIENPNVPIDSDLINLILGGWNQSDSGINVNRETILGYPAFSKGLTIISETIGKLPLDLYRRLRDGSKELATDHPLYRLVKYRPSPNYSAFEFVTTTQYNATCVGNAYAYIFRDRIGRPIEFLILNPEETYPKMINGNWAYVTRVEGKERRLLAENVIHIKGRGSNGIAGDNKIQQFTQTFALGLATQKYANVFFKNNATPKFVIELPGKFKDEEQREKFRKSFGEVHQGLDNSHKPAILEGGTKVSTLGVSNHDAEFLATREFEILQIANVLNIPAYKLGAKINTSYASLREERQDFLDESLGGWLANWEQELTYKLLSESEQEEYFFEFNRKSYIQSDVRTEHEILLEQLNNGQITLNEYLSINNKPGIGPDGDLHRMPSNLVFVEQQVEKANKEIEKLDQPEPEPQPVQEQPKEDEETPSEDTDERFTGLVSHTLERLLKRVSKAADREAKKGQFADWISQELEKDKRFFLDSFEDFENSEQIATELFEMIAEDFRSIASTTNLLEQLESWNQEQYIKRTTAKLLGL